MAGRPALWITGLLIAGGCVATTMQPLVAIDHPANPAAHASPLAPLSPTLRDTGELGTLASGEAAPSRAGGDSTTPASPRDTPAGTRQTKVYTCPMHPEVRQPEPGDCPICHMHLHEVAPAVSGGAS